METHFWQENVKKMSRFCQVNGSTFLARKCQDFAKSKWKYIFWQENDKSLPQVNGSTFLASKCQGFCQENDKSLP